METYQNLPKIKVIKISVLTPEIKEHISSVKTRPNRKIAEQIREKFNVKVSHVTVGKYKKSLLETKTLTKLTKNITRKPTSIIRQKRFDLSIDNLKQLLDKYPNHTFHDTLEHQFIGKTVVKNGVQTKSGGKLRANLMQLISFLNDVT